MGSTRQTQPSPGPSRKEILQDIAYFEKKLAEIGRGQTASQQQARQYYLPFLIRRKRLLAACKESRGEG